MQSSCLEYVRAEELREQLCEQLLRLKERRRVQDTRMQSSCLELE